MTTTAQIAGRWPSIAGADNGDHWLFQNIGAAKDRNQRRRIVQGGQGRRIILFAKRNESTAEFLKALDFPRCR